MEVPPGLPFELSYRALLPKTEEATNMIVPVCLSATHVGYFIILFLYLFHLLTFNTQNLSYSPRATVRKNETKNERKRNEKLESNVICRYMILEQSSGVAAQALKQNCTLQDIDIHQLQSRLLELSQLIFVSSL